MNPCRLTLLIAFCATLSTLAGTARCRAAETETWSPAAAVAAPKLLSAGLTIWGEIHDNPRHHTVRAAWLGEKPPPAVVFEQLSADLQPAIDAFLARPREERSVDAFLRAVGWENGGWAKYEYRPLFEVVLALHVPIYAGDPERTRIRAVARGDETALPAETLRRLALDRPLAAGLEEASREEIEAAHCGQLPAAAIAPMMRAQRYRDAHLADVALAAVRRRGAALLLTGNSHARKDRGVPWYVAARAPEVPVRAILLIEDQDLAERTGAPSADADAVYVTPAANRSDPCAALGKAVPPSAPAARP